MEHRISLAGPCLLLLAAVLATRVPASVAPAAPAVAAAPSALLPLQRQKKSLQEDLALLLAESLPEQTTAAETTVFRERRRPPPHERRQVVKKAPRHAGVKTSPFPNSRDGSFFSERLHQMDAEMATDDDDGKRRRHRYQPLLQKRARDPFEGGQSHWNPYFPALDDVSVDRRVTRYGEPIFPASESSPPGAYAEDRVDMEAAAIEAALRRMTWEQFVRWIIERQERHREGKDDHDTRPRSVIKRSSGSGKTVSPDKLAALLADDESAKVKRSKSSTAAAATTKTTKTAEQQRSIPKDKFALVIKSTTGAKPPRDGTTVKKKKTKMVPPPARAAATSAFKDRKWVPQDSERTLRSKKSWDEYVGIDKRSAAPPSKRRLPADVDIGSYLSAGNRYKNEIESYHSNDHGYQSDDGYQSDGGYNDNDGYQSDGGYHDNNGYQSDGGYHSNDVYQGNGGYYDNDGYQSDGVNEIPATETDPSEQELKDYLVKWYFQKMLDSVGGRIGVPDYLTEHLPHHFFSSAGPPDPRDHYTFVAPDDDEEEDDRKKRAPHRLMTASTVPGAAPESDPDDVNPPLRVVEERLRKLEDVILLSATRLLEKELDSRGGKAGTGAGAPDATESDVVDHLKAAFGLEKVRDALVEFREAFNKIRLKEDLAMLSGSEAEEEEDDWKKKKMRKRLGGPNAPHANHHQVAPVVAKKSGEAEKVEPIVKPSTPSAPGKASQHDHAAKASDVRTEKEVSKTVQPADESEASFVPCPVVSDAVEYCRELGDALGEVGHLFARQCVEHMLCFTCDPSPNVCDELFLRDAASMCGDDFRCQAIAGAMRSVFLSNRDEFRNGHHALCRADRCVDKLRRQN